MQDKRRFPRFTVDGLHGQMVFTSSVDVMNLSLGGVSLRANHRLDIGADYVLRLDVASRPMRLEANVVWSSLTGIRRIKGEAVAQYSAGLQFTDVLTDKLQALMDFIDEHKVSEEHRLGGIRFQISAPGKALLDTLERYRVRRISLSGMLIEIGRAPKLEDVQALEILMGDDQSLRMSGRIASVFHSEAEGRQEYRVGVEFADVPPEDHARLKAFLSAIAPS